MASTIIPTAPIKPITDAKSIFYLTLLKKQIARQCSNIRTKPDRQRVSVWNKTLEMLNNCYGFMGYDQGRRGQTARFSHGRGQTIAFTRRCRPHIYWERADRGYENEAFGPTSTDRFDDARRRIDSPGV
jgi:hypothetical protein